MKHQEVHNNINTKFCHYFNNKKECPFNEIGCMFKHTEAPECKYQLKCNIRLCQFQHSSEEKQNEVSSKCSFCDEIFQSQENLDNHIKTLHGQKEEESFPCAKA